MKKSNQNLILLLAAAGIGVYLFMQMRRKRGTVDVSDVEIISESEFEARKPTLVERAPSIIESVSKVTAALFPKREQKKAVKKIKTAPKADPRFATAQSRGLATFIQAAQQSKKPKVGSMDNISVLY